MSELVICKKCGRRWQGTPECPYCDARQDVSNNIFFIIVFSVIAVSILAIGFMGGWFS